MTQRNHTRIRDPVATTEIKTGELGAAALAQRYHTRIRDLLATFEIQRGELGAAALTQRNHSRICDLFAIIETQRGELGALSRNMLHFLIVNQRSLCVYACDCMEMVALPKTLP